jgi:hypothetical protein
MTHAIAALDVGALDSVGWWMQDGTKQPCLAERGEELREALTNLERLVEAVATRLDDGGRVALGFECPLFVPLPLEMSLLGKQRSGEEGRPWSAGAGATVATYGAQQVTWVLRGIRSAVTRSVTASTDINRLDDVDLFVWEAFVTEGAKAEDDGWMHVADARAAVEKFVECRSKETPSAINDTSVINLAAAYLARAGWDVAVDSLLSEPCFVAKAAKAGYDWTIFQQDSVAATG